MGKRRRLPKLKVVERRDLIDAKKMVIPVLVQLGILSN